MSKQPPTGPAKITFQSKKESICPVCENTFYREELLTGRGRLIAGKLTAELRRLYEPSQKYGNIYPLIYPITVCPSCYYASFSIDFQKVPKEAIPEIKKSSKERHKSIEKIFPNIDFTSNRGLEEGVASYYLAIYSYEFFPPQAAPSIKRGISAIRAAWICNDLHKKYPNENYNYLARVFYCKAQFFYSLAVDLEQNGTESLAEVPHLGPDLDKNYSHDGVYYLLGLLEFYYGDKSDPQKRIKRIEYAKRAVAKLFGMGKATKDKPTALLENAKDLHEAMTKEVAELTNNET